MLRNFFLKDFGVSHIEYAILLIIIALLVAGFGLLISFSAAEYCIRYPLDQLCVPHKLKE